MVLVKFSQSHVEATYNQWMIVNSNGAIDL